MQPMSATADLEQRVQTLGEQAKGLAVVDQQSYDTAADRLRGLVALRLEITNHHAEMKHRSYQAWQAVIAAEKKLLDPVAEAERVYKSRIGAYETEQRRLEAEARARAEAEARERAARQREEEIEQAEAQGADAEEVAALCAEPLPPVMAEPPSPAFQKAAGISTAANWKAECVSLPQLLRAIADGKASVSLVTVNQAAINGLARATRGTLAVPGLRFFNETIVRAKR